MTVRDSGLEVSSVTGLILAGGRASRMHNLDKGLQQLNGQSLVGHVIAKLKPQVACLAINANRHLDDYARFGLPVWPDSKSRQNEESDFKGPLAGVETGLIHCTTSYLLIVPCDSPFLPLDLARRLMAAIRHADVAVACTGNPASPKLQPVFCLIKASMHAQLQQYLDSGGRKMDGWYGNAGVAKVHFSDDNAFTNINTLGELQAIALATNSNK